MRFVIILVILFVSSVFYAQNESSIQKTLITKRTATWCPNCGSWGWDFAKAIEELNNPYGILIKAHYSGDLQSKAAQDITENFNANYQPEFYLNEEIQSVGSSTWESKLEGFDNDITNNASANSKVKLSGTSHKTETGVKLDANVEILENISGDFYFAGYLVEDGIINSQSGRSSEAVHNAVLRASFSESSFGNLISEGSIASGQKFDLNEEIEIDGEEIENRSFRVLLVLWRKNETQYVIENVHSFEVALSANVNDLLKENNKISIYQNNDKLIFNLEKTLQEEIKLEVFDLQGRSILVKNKFLNPNKNQEELNINGLLRDQYYFIKLTGKSGKSYSELLYLYFV